MQIVKVGDCATHPTRGRMAGFKLPKWLYLYCEKVFNLFIFSLNVTLLGGKLNTWLKKSMRFSSEIAKSMAPSQGLSTRVGPKLFLRDDFNSYPSVL